MSGSAEGEEAVYVVLELPSSEALPTVGQEVVLKGMDSAAPQLQMPSGHVLVGQFEEVPGTQLILGDGLPSPGGQALPGLIQTDKKIVFRRAVDGAGTAATASLPTRQG